MEKTSYSFCSEEDSLGTRDGSFQLDVRKRTVQAVCIWAEGPKKWHYCKKTACPKALEGIMIRAA